MSGIDIKGLDKADVLAALYNGARAQGLGFLHATNGDMTREAAQALLDSGQTYFDYLHGRVMKVDLSGDELNPWLYDRDNGEGAAITVIRQLRENGTTSGDDIQRLHNHGMATAATALVNSMGGDSVVHMAREAARPYAD